jgi:hypothetical protein
MWHRPRPYQHSGMRTSRVVFLVPDRERSTGIQIKSLGSDRVL